MTRSAGNMIPPCRRSIVILAKSIAAMMLAGYLMAAAAPAAVPAPEAAPAQDQADTGRSPRETIALIHQLSAGKLAPEIDPKTLFLTSIGGKDTERTKILLTLLNNPRLLARARKSLKALPQLPPEMAALTVAQAEFLALPRQRRIRLLQAHHRRAEQAKEAQQQRAEKTARLSELTHSADGLQAFLDGKPTDPGSLAINLLDPQEAALRAERRKTLLQPPEPTAQQSPADKSSLNRKIAHQIARIDTLRARILTLSPEKRQELYKTATAATPEQAKAAAAREAAEEARKAAAKAALIAEQARSEAEKLLAGERSKLLTIRQAQAHYELALTQSQDIAGKARETALGWRRKLRELQARSSFDPGKRTDADRLYFQLVDALRTIRSNLNMALSSSSSNEGAKLDPPRLDETILRDRAKTEPLVQLRQQLVDNALRLRGLAQSLRWKERTALMSAMIEMNEIRLSLIDDLSPAMRSQIIGFGETGVAQVGRELNQILLTIRYNILYLPQHLDSATHPIFHPTPSLIFSLIQMLLVIFLFRYWRQHGDRLLTGIEYSSRRRRPPTVASTALAAGTSYFRQARRPFDWLVLLLVLRWLMPPEIDVAGADYAWMIVSWLLIGGFLVQMSNALAHGNRRNDPHAMLRQRSLQLVAAVVIIVGLILSLTSATVGRGAIYHWVFSACWLLVIPVTMLLTSWWRDEITALAESGASASPLLAWCVRNQQGPIGYFARVIAGLTLLLQGTRRVLVRRANDIALIREIADQRARSRAAARVAADEASGRFRPLGAEVIAVLDPHRLPALPITDVRRPDHLKFPELTPAGLIAVVGERGLGKTTTLNDMIAQSAAKEHHRVRCRDGGYHSVLVDLGQSLGVAGTENEILATLKQRPFSTITIDDVQRLIVPAIGGLQDFDRLIALARMPGTAASWAMSIGGPAWSYLSRARGERLIFDQIITLPNWEPDELRALIERRSEQAQIDPAFDQLEHSGLMSFDSDLTPEERVKRAYFTSLTEYCDGNPAVALEFWRRSLFEDTTSGYMTVRTFATPQAKSLLALPQSTAFVLRALLQMEVATPETIQRGTDLPATLITDALRNLNRANIVKPHEHGYRVTLYWYREVIRLLERQNLLVRSAT